MPTASATIPGSLDAVADLRAWSEWMPGVVAVRVDAQTVTWTIQSPAGEVPVPLTLTADGDAIALSGGGGPFTAVDCRVRAAGGGLVLELTLEPAPEAMVQGIVDGAAVALHRRLVAASVARAPAGPEPRLVHVGMSDGAVMAVHHYDCGTRAPAIALVIPYRKESAFLPPVAAGFVGAGYHVLIADVRGFGGSSGPWRGQYSPREIDDGAELVEWAGRQEFCDGNVGLMGMSYCGGNQILIAARKPRGLRCIAPVVGLVDTYRDMWKRGGIPSHTGWGAGTYLRSQQRETARAGLEEFYLRVALDPLDGAWHHERSPEYALADVDVPTLAIGGWHDYFLRGTIRTYHGASTPHKRLVIGPWGHGDFDPSSELLSWYGHWLRGEGDEPRGVRVYRTGAEQWVDLDDWPVRRDWRALPVEPATLRVVTHIEAVPPAPNPKRQLIVDPTDSGVSTWGEGAAFDVHTFDADTVVEGTSCLHAVLRVRNCEDVDVHARLSSGGRQLCEGRLRASHRTLDRSRTVYGPEGLPAVPWHTHDREQPVPDDQPVEVDVEIGAISHLFRAGDVLRLGITLVRADEGAVPSTAFLEPATRLLVGFA